MLTASNPLSPGSKSYTVTPTGGGGDNGSVTVDNTQPAASDIETINAASGTFGRTDAGDKVVYTFSEAMDPCSLVPGWDGTGTTNVVVRIGQNASNDPMTIWNSSNTTQLPFGTVKPVTPCPETRPSGPPAHPRPFR